MTKTEKFDVVSIFFDGDRVLQEIQTRTMVKFMPAEFIGKVIFVCNEERNEERDAFFRDKIEHALREYNVEWSLYYANDLAGPAINGSGWRSQQTLKLSVASKVSSSLYYVLDAKNHFIRQIAKTDIFGASFKPRSFWARPTGNLKECFVRTCDFFALDPAPYLEKAMPATTPYLLYKDHVLNMIEFIEEKESCSLNEVFMKRNRFLTEFFCYFAFLCKRTSGPPEFYDFGRRSAVSLFTRWPVDEETADQLLQRLADPSIYVFGLHRNRIPQLTPNQKSIIANFWVHNGTALTFDEARRWLS